MGGSKTAIFTQVVHFYPDGVGHITVGGNMLPPLSSGGASIEGPWLRLHIPLIEPDGPV